MIPRGVTWTIEEEAAEASSSTLGIAVAGGPFPPGGDEVPA